MPPVPPPPLCLSVSLLGTICWFGQRLKEREAACPARLNSLLAIPKEHSRVQNVAEISVTDGGRKSRSRKKLTRTVNAGNAGTQFGRAVTKTGEQVTFRFRDTQTCVRAVENSKISVLNKNVLINEKTFLKFNPFNIHDIVATNEEKVKVIEINGINSRVEMQPIPNFIINHILFNPLLSEIRGTECVPFLIMILSTRISSIIICVPDTRTITGDDNKRKRRLSSHFTPTDLNRECHPARARNSVLLNSHRGDIDNKNEVCFILLADARMRHYARARAFPAGRS